MDPASELRQVIRQTRLLVNAHVDSGLDFSKYSENIGDFLKEEKPALKTLDDLKTNIGECTRCGLAKERNKLVFGEGNENAELVFVGEGPGYDEDMAGRPFVGAAGKLLTDIIEKGMGLKREDVYICNVVKCRPPGNRDPQKIETDTCLPFLAEQIKIIKPRFICALGRIAAQALLKRDVKITQERGNWYSFMDIPLMLTYHPAFVLRNTSRMQEVKGEVWEDIKAIMARMGLEV